MVLTDHERQLLIAKLAATLGANAADDVPEGNQGLFAQAMVHQAHEIVLEAEKITLDGDKKKADGE